MHPDLAHALETAAKEAFARYHMYIDPTMVRVEMRQYILQRLCDMVVEGHLRPLEEYDIDINRLRVRQHEWRPDEVTIYFEEPPPPPLPPYKPPPEPPPGQIDDWEQTMTRAEVDWCWQQIRKKMIDDEFEPGDCCDSFRAARAWKSSQVRRFKRLRSCCGSHEWVAYRWSWRKLRFDKYILGFNYGH